MEVKRWDDLPENYQEKLLEYVDKINELFPIIDTCTFNFKINVLHFALMETLSLAKDPLECADFIHFLTKKVLENHERRLRND